MAEPETSCKSRIPRRYSGDPASHCSAHDALRCRSARAHRRAVLPRLTRPVRARAAAGRERSPAGSRAPSSRRPRAVRAAPRDHASEQAGSPSPASSPALAHQIVADQHAVRRPPGRKLSHQPAIRSRRRRRSAKAGAPTPRAARSRSQPARPARAAPRSAQKPGQRVSSEGREIGREVDHVRAAGVEARQPSGVVAARDDEREDPRPASRAP